MWWMFIAGFLTGLFGVFCLVFFGGKYAMKNPDFIVRHMMKAQLKGKHTSRKGRMT